MTGLTRKSKANLNSSSGNSKKTWSVINYTIRPKKTDNCHSKFSKISVEDNQVIEDDFLTAPYDIVNK